jgi:hypothetical protein
MHRHDLFSHYTNIDNIYIYILSAESKSRDGLINVKIFGSDTRVKKSGRRMKLNGGGAIVLFVNYKLVKQGTVDYK